MLATEILAGCRRLGFAVAGICDAAPTRWGAELIAWLEAGKHGSMAYLANHCDVRLNPGLMLEGARSIIMVADLYESRGTEEGNTSPPDPPGGRASPPPPVPAGSPLPQGRIARYARGRDYHKVMKRRLFQLADELRHEHPSHQFRTFVDTAPVLEREYAARAGIGWTGKHTLIIHPQLGSYMLLGGILTTLEIPVPAEQREVADHCGTCTRCIDACPTGAISPYSVDAQRCISYLTIEHRGPVAREFHEAIGDWLYGCDICQEICPHNSPRPTRAQDARHPDYTPARFPRYRESLPLLETLSWRPEDRARALEGSAMKRATLDMLKRNALIVAGNILARNDDPALRERLHEIARDADESEMVREAAARTIDRLDNSPVAGLP